MGMKGSPGGKVSPEPQVLIVSHNHSLSKQSRSTVQTFINNAGLKSIGFNDARRTLPDNERSGFTKDTIDPKYDLLYDGRTPLDRMLGPRCPQVVCGPPHQMAKVAHHHWESIRLVIFDEADEIIDSDGGGGKGGGEQSNEAKCREIVKKCKNAQIALFSATFSDKAKRVAATLTDKNKRETHKVFAKSTEQSVDSIVQCCLKLGARGDIENKLQ